MQTYVEVFSEIPWGAAGLTEPSLPTHLLAKPGGAGLRPRIPPLLRSGGGGALWVLSALGEVGCVRSGLFNRVDISTARIHALTDLAPLSDGGIVLLGENEGQNVLARLDARGQLVWRRTGPETPKQLDLPSLTGDFDGLLYTQEGAVYLPGTRISGQIARIELATGASPVTIDLGSYRGRVYLQGDTLYRVVLADGSRRWVRRSLRTGAEVSGAGDRDLQDALAVPLAPAPDGGALLSRNGSLLWMASSGRLHGEATLAGMVRHGGAILTAVHDGGRYEIQRHSGGQTSVLALLSGIDASARLVATDGSHFQFLARDAKGSPVLVRAAAGSSILDQKPVAAEPEQMIDTSTLDISRLAVGADGNVYLPIVDQSGVFIVLLHITSPR
jgi:hypothetical protein